MRTRMDGGVGNTSQDSGAGQHPLVNFRPCVARLFLFWFLVSTPCFVAGVAKDAEKKDLRARVEEKNGVHPLSADSSCKQVPGGCKPCTVWDKGAREKASCKAYNCTENGGDDVKFTVRTEPCPGPELEKIDSSSFWYFEIAMTVTLAISAWVVTQRKRKIRRIRQKRLSKLVNSS